MEDNVSDDQAHQWLAQTYPQHLTMRSGKAVPRDNAGELPPPKFESELHVSASLDESSIEETLLPAARRRLAETRLQMLSTMVLMGINRIVITSGKIRATMGFHIDTSDSAFERTAEDIDARVAVRGHYNALVWGVEASASLAYVSSKRGGSDAEINVESDLTGEVELHFKSDYFPVERFANQGTLKAISNNTGVPEANPPPRAPPAAPTEAQSFPTFKSPQTKRRTREAPPAMSPIGAPLPEPKLPTAPIERGALDPGAKRPVPQPEAKDGKEGKDAKADKKETKPAPEETPAPAGEETPPPAEGEGGDTPPAGEEPAADKAPAPEGGAAKKPAADKAAQPDAKKKGKAGGGKPAADTAKPPATSHAASAAASGAPPQAQKSARGVPWTVH
jgi:hypothetical protein